MNTFGRNFRLSIFGESHGDLIGITLDGVRAGIPLDQADFEFDLSRRRSGASGTTARKESDTPRIVSGIYNGYSTGAPLTIVFENEDTRSADYAKLITHPRPSHADWVANQKWSGYNDPRGGGHFSGRLTLPLTAGGVVAKKMLPADVELTTQITEIGGKTTDFDQTVAAAAAAGDSVGGVVECRVKNLAIGLGSPFFDSVESVISHILFAIPAVRGVEFGDGMASAKMLGSQHNDPIVNQNGSTALNHAGGVVGGLTTGNDLIVRVAIKPTSSIAKSQQTYNFATQTIEPLAIDGRHDACIALRAAVVVEAAVAVALTDLYLSM